MFYIKCVYVILIQSWHYLLILKSIFTCRGVALCSDCSLFHYEGISGWGGEGFGCPAGSQRTSQEEISRDPEFIAQRPQ